MKDVLKKQMSQELGPADEIRYSNVDAKLAKKNLTRMRLDPNRLADPGQEYMNIKPRT